MRAGSDCAARLSDAVLRGVAGSTVFDRGQAYFDEQRVIIRRANASEVAADVSGSDEYRTRLWFEGDRMYSQCTCPHAEEGAFCKHMVATALAWRSSLGIESGREKRKGGPAAEAARRKSAGEERLETLRRFLVDQDKGWLAEQLLQAATGDSVLEKRLLLAARTRQAEDDPKALERALSEAIANPGTLDWQGSNRFAHRLDAPIDHLAQLLDAGRTQAALGGCLYLLKRLLAIYERSDDSGGAIGDRVHYLGRLTDKALRAVRPGKALALKLVEVALADHWSVFGDADHTHWFDAKGLAAFEAEIQKRFRALKPLPPGKSRFTSGDDRFRLQSWMESIARRRGDVDALISLMLGGADVSAYDHLRAAEALEQAGRLRDATALLERAARHFDDERLLERLEQNYRRDGCDADAHAMLWRRFERRPQRESFAQLVAAAGTRWPEWRERAYSAIANVEAGHLEQAKKWQPNAVPDPGLRISCLLVEGRIEEAAAIAESQPLPLRTLDAALHQFARVRPETAFALLRRWLPDALRNANASQYRRVGEVLLDVGRHQRATHFAALLAQLRAEQARRPRLVEILDDVARQLAPRDGTPAERGSPDP